MQRKGTVSTLQQLEAASAEVQRLQQKLKHENASGSQKPTPNPSKKQQIVLSQTRNPLRQALMITAAFAVFWLIATRVINSGRATTVFDSIAAGDADAVAEWTRRTPLEAQVVVSKREQWAALHAAADSGREDIVKILLDAGHDAGSLDMHKATPLHRAAASGSLKTVTLLLNAGASLTALDKFGTNAHAWAVKYGHKHLLQLLRPGNAEQT